jgi:hypothetical protein
MIQDWLQRLGILFESATDGKLNPEALSYLDAAPSTEFDRQIAITITQPAQDRKNEDR